MVIFERNNVRLLATIVARDEEDIIGPMIEHHIEEGVTDILFTDNSSKDRTVEIASRYPEVREITVSDDMTHNQESHTTRMARLACKFMPDWIVHLDADEFWCGLGDVMTTPIHHEALWATKAHVHPPVPGNKFSLSQQRHYIDFRGFAREFKVIHRPNPKIVIRHGNHSVEGVECAVINSIFRHHYPIRSYDQFERKVVQGATALKARSFVCERWYKWFDQWQQGTLRSFYDLLTNGWDAMVKQDQIEEATMKRLLVDCYGVQHELAEETFDDLNRTGLKPQIRKWQPNFKRKPLL